jgi:outer membrane receptor protein involved in Fe transport
MLNKIHPSRIFKFMPLFLLLCLAASIQIEVKDSSGAAMSTSGRLINLSSGIVTPFEVSADGKKTLDTPASGLYRIELFKPGFATQSLDLDLRTTSSITKSITMSVGSGTYRLDVASTAPLPGVERSLDEIASPIQLTTTADIENSGALNLPDFMNRRLNGVYLNEIQGNPYQMDLNYRGSTASPLLGTPQGISIYMDGVRLNQPFGDVISWDLIPKLAISEMTMVPGSNPLFGLNTLGGALAIETKDGRRHPGTSISLSGGSFARKMADIEHGGSNAKGLDWFLASSLFFEDGWRESSPSNVRQFFGKLGHQGQKTSLGITVAFANNSLTGNGLQEQRFLDRNFASVYTKPDLTNQRSPFINLRGRRSLTSNWSASGNIYYRHIDTNTLNGDINEESLDQSVYQPSAAEIRALTAAGYTGFPLSGANATNTPFPFWRCIANVLLRDEPGEKCNGLLNRSTTNQHNYGFAGQLSWANSKHQFTAGAAFDGNRVGFVQSTQLGYLNPDRSVTGLPAFADGVTGGDTDGEPLDNRVNLKSRINTGSIFATDTMSAGSRWTFTFSGRFNRTAIVNRDRITPGGGLGSLDGDHTYSRFNPSISTTFKLPASMNAYFGYTEGNRAPTAIELGCADPNSPCRLPNALAGDPPLKQVVTRSIETGLRGDIEANWKWNVGFFRAENRDDLLFVASEQTGFGYFRNFGKTRRQGLEAALSGRIRKVSLGANYTWLDATFQSPEEVNGTGNSSNEDAQDGIPGQEGTIEIDPGARIPLVPRHTAKAYADIQLTSKFTVNLGMVAISSMIARGNENGQHKADGRYYLGPGHSPGYAVANLGARYQLTNKLQFFLQANNLFDRRYFSAAQLGPTGFTATGNFIARPFPAIEGEFPVQQATFYAPGAPRSAWAGLRFSF